MNSQLFKPAKSPIATLLIVHGMAEHQERYAQFAQFLADHAIAVMTFNHLGHGLEAQKNKQLGYMGNPNPAEKLKFNSMKYANELRAQYPDIPHFILGHSMGSFVVRSLLRNHSAEFDGAVLMGTSSPNPINIPLLKITQLLNSLSPKKINAVLDKVLNQVNNQPFAEEAKNTPELLRLNWLNSNPEHVKKYVEDPLCGFPFTNNGYFGLMRLMYEGTNKNWSQEITVDLPMLFISGEDDPIGQMGKGIPIIVSDLKERGFEDVSEKQYAGMRHEILQEDDHQKVYDDILQWLVKHIEFQKVYI